MLIKTILVILLTVTLSTAGAMANNTKQLNTIAGKQQVLSKKIVKAYGKNNKSVDIMITIDLFLLQYRALCLYWSVCKQVEWEV